VYYLEIAKRLIKHSLNITFNYFYQTQYFYTIFLLLVKILNFHTNIICVYTFILLIYSYKYFIFNMRTLIVIDCY